MEMVQHATEGKTLDIAEAKAKKHLDEAEITQEQHTLITNEIKTKRESLK
jgi:hypothetical protein